MLNLHQTWQWCEFQALSNYRGGFSVVPLDLPGKPAALILNQRLPMNKSWLYCPRGPEISVGQISAFSKFFSDLKSGLDKNNVFFRFEPEITDGYFNDEGHYIRQPELLTKALEGIKCAARTAKVRLKPAHAHYQPQNTLILNLLYSEDDLLLQMKPKGRYNIKVAQKHQVKIEKFDPRHTPKPLLKDAVHSFYQLLIQTTGRDGFSGHSESYYLQMLEHLNSSIPESSERELVNIHPAPHSYLYLAKYNGETVAGIIVTHHQKTAIYYFGASGNLHRNVMAPYLLQWQAIKDAKSAGLHFYDFLGISPLNQKTGEPERNHPWAKVTDFKLKFGGTVVNYLPAQELVFQPFWYYLIRFVKKIKSVFKARSH